MSFSVLQAARDQPARDALIVDGNAWSYQELAARVRAAMESLGPLAKAPGSRVALVARPEAGTLVSLLALVELRRTVVLLHPRATEAEHAALLENAPAVLVIASVTDGGGRVVSRGDQGGRGDQGVFLGTNQSNLPELPALPDLPLNEHRRPDQRRSTDPPPATAEDILAVLATSGTTGAPRAVALSHRALECAAAASEANLGVTDEDRWLLALPFAHVGGLSVILRSVRARRAVVLAGGAASSPATLIEVLARDRVTLLSLVPAQLHRLLTLSSPPLPLLPHLRAVLVGGAAASPALMARARERGLPVLATYGLTESCGQVATEQLSDATGGDCGPPLPGMEVRVTDEGAITLRGGSLLSGYLELDALCSALDEDGWLVTRDAGRLDARGHLHVLGRLDDVIVTAGEKVHPLEVERALEAAPGVVAACAFALPDDERGAVVAAALVADPAAARATSDELSAALSVLAPWKRPRHVAWFEALALGATGKVDRRAVAAAARAVLSRCG